MKNIFGNNSGGESTISPKPKSKSKAEIKERLTTSILYYKFKLKNLNLLLINTPGISENNSNLSAEDIDFLQNTKRVIKTLGIQTIVFYKNLQSEHYSNL